MKRLTMTSNRRPSILFAIIGLSVLAFTFSAACDWLWSQNVILKRTIETVSRELRGQMFEVQRARERRAEMAEFRFMADAMQAWDTDLYQIAKSAWKWGRVYGVEPSLILAVIHRESNMNRYNRSYDQNGQPLAYGPMQVNLRVWKDELNLDPARIDEIDYNIQHGTIILRRYLDAAGGNIGKALLRYYGGTPDVHGFGYSEKVLGSKYLNMR